jgi:hypothetical protein
MAFALAPVLSRLLDALSNQLFDGEISFGGSAFGIPGVRLTLWLGGLIILFAGVVAFRNVKAVTVEEST